IPTEEDVARRLHEPLTFDHPLPVVGVSALADERLQYGRLCLLGLQEERILSIPAQQQDDPGAGPDASDADHLPCEMNEAEVLEQMLPVSLQGSTVRTDQFVDRAQEPGRLVRRKQLLDGHDQWGLADDPS